VTMARNPNSVRGKKLKKKKKLGKTSVGGPDPLWPNEQTLCVYITRQILD